MLPVYAIASNISTSLGLTTDEVWHAVISGQRGIQRYDDTNQSVQPFWASRISEQQWDTIKSASNTEHFSAFEQLAIFSIKDALTNIKINLAETVLVLATTKGNIETLGIENDERNLLSTSADFIASAISIAASPVVISHACVSGVTALQYGLSLLQAEKYKNAIVIGADQFTRFVLSGFQSFQAIADEPCKPFDANRKGINLGEAAATIILSTDAAQQPLARLCAGATSNDANHISGPSRTGAELAMAIDRTLKQAAVIPEEIQMISAHGTATLYNDEMESKAFALAGLLHADVHSLKGYLGHTLGAAGVLESAMCIKALQEQQVIPSAGFETIGVPEPIHVTTKLANKKLDYVLKTASGFGGCNSVVLWAKAERA